jgi:hypothetical protein
MAVRSNSVEGWGSQRFQGARLPSLYGTASESPAAVLQSCICSRPLDHSDQNTSGKAIYRVDQRAKRFITSDQVLALNPGQVDERHSVG